MYLFEDFSLFEAKTEQLPGDKLSGTDRHISRLTLTSDVSKAVMTRNMTYEDASDGTYQDDLDNFADLSEKEQLRDLFDWRGGPRRRMECWVARRSY